MTMFRFTIRDVLWLTVVVGMALGWWIDRSRECAPLIKSHESLQEIRQLVGEQSLNDLVEMAKRRNRARPNSIAPDAVVINLPNRPKPATAQPATKASKLKQLAARRPTLNQALPAVD
jgi:hypothetical protein